MSERLLDVRGIINMFVVLKKILLYLFVFLLATDNDCS